MTAEEALWLGVTWATWFVVQEIGARPNADGRPSVSKLLIGAGTIGLTAGSLVAQPTGVLGFGLAFIILMLQATAGGAGTEGERRRRLASMTATVAFMAATGIVAHTESFVSPWQAADPTSTKLLARWLMSLNILWMLGSPTNKLIQEVMLRAKVLSDSMEGHGKYTIKKEQRNIKAGELIGFLERSIAAALVVLGAYEAIGFLVAAKGLIRLRSLEKEDFAEYVLLGTLLSLFPAVAAGLALKYLVLTI